MAASREQAIKNLKKKGAAANPNGRPPKGYSITALAQEIYGDPAKKAAVIQAIHDKAVQGDVAAAKLIWSYLDGQPKAEIKNDNTINLNVEGIPSVYRSKHQIPKKTR